MDTPSGKPLAALQLLAGIVKRPGLYWGNSDNNFQSFVAFCSGFHMTSLLVPGFYRTAPGSLIPIHFDHFVTEYHGYRFPHSGCGWMSFIEEHTGSDTEALELLLKLRELYESSRFPALDEEMILELEAKDPA